MTNDVRSKEPVDHEFVQRPNKTLVALTVPVLFSMVAEPLCGLVDTSFISQLGSVALAALGVGTVTLSSLFWIFNFLGIGSQTEVAQNLGNKDQTRASQIAGLAMLLAIVFGLLIGAVGIVFASAAARAMGADDAIQAQAVEYMHIRFLGSPAVLVSMAAFGVLRGMQDMKTPMKIAAGLNLMNIALDPVLIFGFGPVPACGIAGAATATVVSQWFGALWATRSVIKELGMPKAPKLADAAKLMKVGGDLFVRTGLLTLFILVATRAATKVGADCGAAHQAIRQIWIFSALFLDSFAITGQSLVAYFLGAGWFSQARRVAAYVSWWSIGTGVALGMSMLLTTKVIQLALVPDTALPFFGTAWLVAALSQPVNALAFATDGIHWGTGDFALLRNVMILATGVGASALLFSGVTIGDALTTIWAITTVWVTIRATFGVTRVFPGFGKSPLLQVDVYSVDVGTSAESRVG